MMLTTFVALAALVASAIGALITIRPSQDLSFCVGVDTKSSTQVSLFSSGTNPPPEQCLWNLNNMATVDNQEITRPRSGTEEFTCLTLPDTANGTPVEALQCDQIVKQQWNMLPGALVSIIFGDNNWDLCLENKDGLLQEGNLVQISKCVSDNTNQKWNVRSANTVSAPAVVVNIKPTANISICLALDPHHTNQVGFFACSELGDQQRSWRISDEEGGQSTIVSEQTRCCLGSSDTANGSPVECVLCGHNKFEIFTVGLGRRPIPLTDKNHTCLDYVDGRLVDGTRIQTWDCEIQSQPQSWNVTLFGPNEVQP